MSILQARGRALSLAPNRWLPDHLSISNEAGIKISQRLQIGPPRRIFYDHMFNPIYVLSTLHQYGMPLIDDGDEWLAACESLGEITANGGLANCREVVVNKGNHIRWHHTFGSNLEAFDVCRKPT